MVMAMGVVRFGDAGTLAARLGAVTSGMKGAVRDVGVLGVVG
jgi:hypothetical protein